ncbi:hypothetical protein PIB30_022921 [Stylosanthes scabra]|uniref:Uncharacterized protein n=1 Tax=Stylosanthes scabra TaxID=79078 RepID=A0ABU6Q8Z0_9FABA|nr:hypothetical protein [Stylosanthes scabra]
MVRSHTTKPAKLRSITQPTSNYSTTLLPSSPYYTAEDLDSWRKLDVRPSSRILRQPSKLEPVPEKSDEVRSYGELTRSVIIANPTDPELALDNHRSYFLGGPISRPRSFMISSSHNHIYNGGSLLFLND